MPKATRPCAARSFQRLSRSAGLGAAALVLAGCATGPHHRHGADHHSPPAQAREGQALHAAHHAHHDSAERLARTLMAIWASGDTGELDAITTDDIVYDDVPNGTQLRGRKAVRAYVAHVHAWAGRVTIDVTRVHHGHDAALAEWVMRGVQDRPIHGRVPVATGRGFVLRGATLVQVREGRIHRAADYIDVLGLVLQLGSRVELPGGVVLPTLDTPAPSPAGR